MSTSTVERVTAAVRAQHPHGSIAFWVSQVLTQTGSIQRAAQSLGLPRPILADWIRSNGYTVHHERMVWLTRDDKRVGSEEA